MKLFSLFFTYFINVKSANEKILNVLLENKDKIIEILKEEGGKIQYKDENLYVRLVEPNNFENYCFFVINKKYSEMNSFLKNFENIKSQYKDVKLGYRWAYDVDNCFFEKSPLYTQLVSNFFIHVSRYRKIDDNIYKYFHAKKNEIERYVEFSETFLEFEKTIIKEKKNIILSDYFSLMEEMCEYQSLYAESLKDKKSLDPIYKFDSEYTKAPRFFAFCEGILPVNQLSDVAKEFQKYFDIRYSYDTHISNLKDHILGESKINNHLVRIFEYFFDEKLIYKNINSSKILKISFSELQELICDIRSVKFQNIINLKMIKSDSKMGVNMLQILKNLKYIAGLDFITNECWNFFKSYYEKNIDICSVFLLLRNNTVQKLSEILLDSVSKEEIYIKDFFFLRNNKDMG